MRNIYRDEGSAASRASSRPRRGAAAARRRDGSTTSSDSRRLVLRVLWTLLPELEDADDFYHADLIGLKARRPDGAALGTVRAVHDFGAGDLLDIDGMFVPFTRDCVPHIDLDAGHITIIIMPQSDDRPDEEAGGEAL